MMQFEVQPPHRGNRAVVREMAAFEDAIRGGTERAARGFESLRKRSQAFQAEVATKRITDPFGISSMLKTLNTSQLQRSLNDAAAAASSLAQQRARASAEIAAADQRQVETTLAGTQAELTAPAEAIGQGSGTWRPSARSSARRPKSWRNRRQHRSASPASRSMRAASLRQRPPRLFASEQEAIVVAAERPAASLDRASVADRGYAAAAREAAAAAGVEAQRLEGQAAVHARVARSWPQAASGCPRPA